MRCGLKLSKTRLLFHAFGGDLEAFDVFVGLDGGFGAGAGSNNGLSVMGIGAVTGSKNAWYFFIFTFTHLRIFTFEALRAIIVGDDVTLGITSNVILEELGIGMMTDG